ncbi:MAG: GH116 family glycosyl hydrolase [Arachnia sp.]
MSWRPDEHPAVAMPLGGVGTGSLALGSDGGWRQVQLMNVGTHHGDLPGTFLALRTQQLEPIHHSTTILQALRDDPGALGRPATPMVNDDLVPAWQRELVERFGGTRTEMDGTYPVAEVRHTTGGPVEVTIRATSPMVPGDLDASGMPVVLVEATLTNRTDVIAWTWLAFSAHNAVGLDPHLNPRGVRAPGYGGNTNRLRRAGRRADLVMENPSVAPSSPWSGQMVLSAEAERVVAFPCYEQPDELIDFLRALAPWGDQTSPAAAPWVQAGQASAPSPRFGPSPQGSTWLGALVAHEVLEPHQSRTVRFALAWHFPNREVDFVQYGPDRPEHGPTRFWVGNHYATRYADALAVADDALGGWDRHWAETTAWTDALDALPLPRTWRTHLATQPVPLRTPTTFRTHDGACYGHEGVLGESTLMWSGNVGGACPLSCTHVWNYASAASAIFPAWERSMRETEFGVMQAPSGALPHRVHLPTYLRQHGDGPVGAPDEPALDGMCGAVLKTYRELRRGAVDLDWLRERWPRVVALMDHIAGCWDPDNTGLLHGIQPTTHDICLNGANTFTGTFWLAALRAAEELARLLGDHSRADAWRGRFETSSRALDEACFHGGWYIQVPDPSLPEKFQWGAGCLSDQLIGQWWAHQLDLGYLLPAEHVREALANVVRHNLLDDAGTDRQRPYATAGERGLVVCTWPRGGRPAEPTPYCDEVWTGAEYEVAAHLAYEGMAAESAAVAEAIWARHDGRRRNPFNEVECGDHYARAMAGWSLLEATLGLRWNQLDQSLRVGGDGTFPLITGRGWGTVEITPETARVRCRRGVLDVATIVRASDGATFRLADVSPEDGVVEVRLG